MKSLLYISILLITAYNLSAQQVIKGTVTDAGNGQPVDAATVQIRKTGRQLPLTYTILLFTVTGCLIAVPSVTPGLLAVAAVPAALLMPLTFIRIQRTVGTLLYLILYITCIVNILQ